MIDRASGAAFPQFRDHQRVGAQIKRLIEKTEVTAFVPAVFAVMRLTAGEPAGLDRFGDAGIECQIITFDKRQSVIE
jgi:hypothetical protein